MDNIMDVLIPFLTSTETPFFFLFVTLFVFTIRASAKREDVCNKKLEQLMIKQDQLLRFIKEERRVKKDGS